MEQDKEGMELEKVEVEPEKMDANLTEALQLKTAASPTDEVNGDDAPDLGPSGGDTDANFTAVSPSSESTLSEQLSAVTSKKDNSTKFFICGLCNLNPVVASTTPKLLPCLHSFCEKCLQERYEKQSGTSTDGDANAALNPRLKCPSCGQEFLVSNNGIAGFLNNQFVIEAVGCEVDIERLGHDEKNCTSCEDESAASSFCLNCREWLCDACKQAHQRVKVTRDHVIKSRVEYEKESDLKEQDSPATSPDQKPLYCKLHPHEQLRLFCATCDKLTCRDCQLVEHKDHRYQFINEAAGKHREVLKKLLQYLKVNLGLLNDTIRDVETVGTGLEEKEKEIEKEITRSVESVIKALKHRERVLVAELQGLVQTKLGLLAKQKKDLTQMSTILEHNHDFAKYAVENGSDVALLYCRKVLGTRLHNLNSLKYRQRPLAYNDLRFALDVEKMCGYLTKIGTVYSQEDLQRRMEQYGIGTKNGASTSSQAPVTQTATSTLSHRDIRPATVGSSSQQVTIKQTGGVLGHKHVPHKLNPIEAMSAVNKRISEPVTMPSSSSTQYIALSSPGIPHYVPKHARGSSSSDHHHTSNSHIILSSGGVSTQRSLSHINGNNVHIAGKKPDVVALPSSKSTTGNTFFGRKDFPDNCIQQIRSLKQITSNSFPMKLPSNVAATLAKIQSLGSERKSKSPHAVEHAKIITPNMTNHVVMQSDKSQGTASHKYVSQGSIVLDSGYASSNLKRHSPDDGPRARSSGSDPGSTTSSHHSTDIANVKKEKPDSPSSGYQHCMQSFALKTNGNFMLMVSELFLNSLMFCFARIYIYSVFCCGVQQKGRFSEISFFRLISQ